MTSNSVAGPAPLDNAEKALEEKRFSDAKAAAKSVLDTRPEPTIACRALQVLGTSSTQLRDEADAEEAWRRLLVLAPAQPRALFGLARAHRSAQRFDEARPLLEQLLAAQPGNVEAIVLLHEVLSALDLALELEPWLEAAQTRAPQNPRLQLLRAEWELRTGSTAVGVATLKQLVAKRPATPAAWLALMREAEGRSAWDEALEFAAAATEACPQTFWLRSRQLMMLAAAGRQLELDAAIRAWPPPALAAREQFVNWATLMLRLDAAGQVRAALSASEPLELESLASSPKGAQLLSDLAREGGDAVQALRWLEQLEKVVTADANLLQRLFNLSLLTGNTKLAESLASRLHRLNPRNHGGLAMFQLHETRIFAGAMARVWEAVHAEPSTRLGLLSRIVVDEPGCYPVALAWLEVFVGSGGRARPSMDGSTPIPRRLWHSVDVTEPWLRHCEGFDWRDIRTPAHFIAARGLLPPKGNRLFMVHPEATRLDLLRLGTLAEHGGWWIEPNQPCSGPVSRMAGSGACLIVSMTNRGFLTPALLGSVPDHPALHEAFRIALLALDEPPRPNSSALTTGMPALSLGVAYTLAKAQLEQGTLPGDVKVVAPDQRNRWLTSPWPK